MKKELKFNPPKHRLIEAINMFIIPEMLKMRPEDFDLKKEEKGNDPS